MDDRKGGKEVSVRSPERRNVLKTGAILGGVGLFGLSRIVRSQSAQSWPSKPVHIIVPFSAGGTADMLSRIASQQLSKQLGQSFVVENKPGAGTTIASALVARAPADGYTVMAITPTFVIAQYVYPNLPYDGQKEFFPLGLWMTTPLILVVHPSTNLRTAAEYIQAAKAKPGQLSFSSSGGGSTPHLALELLKQQTGVEILHIPYKGGGDALTAVLGGTVQSYIGAPIEVGQYVKSGKLIALASTSLTRTPGLADLPTLAESGVPGYEVIHYTGLVMRTGTPPDIVEKFSAQFVASLRSPDVREKIAENGDVPAGTLAEAADLFKREHARWSRVVKAANIKPT